MATKTDEKRSAAWSRASVRKKLVETIGDTTVEYDPLEDGDVYTFPHPFFYDKETREKLRELTDDDEEGVARVLLGDEQYERFVEKGGEGDEISKLLILIQGDTRKSLASGTPTRREN